MNINDDNTFVTSDLALVATLSLTFPIKSIDKNNASRAYFAFLKTPDLENTIEKYWLQKLKVEPQSYFQQLKAIKTRIYT